jgi:hypothetical protein
MKQKQARKPRQKLLPAPEQKEIQVSGKVEIEPQAMIMAAIKGGASMDVIERLMDMRERIKKEQAEIEFRESMTKFQSEIKTVIKSKKVNYTTRSQVNVEYKYTPLNELVSSAAPAMFRNGLSFSFTTKQDKESVTSICHANHSMGHTESTEFTIPIDLDSKMNPAQQVASALTYSKRYAFCNAFGIVTGDFDDDGISTGKIKDDSENQAKKKEAEEKIASLPDYIKEGFRVLGYTAKNVFDFCSKFEWNYAAIKKKIDEIANASNPEKIKNV